MRPVCSRTPVRVWGVTCRSSWRSLQVELAWLSYYLQVTGKSIKSIKYIVCSNSNEIMGFFFYDFSHIHSIRNSLWLPKELLPMSNIFSEAVNQFPYSNLWALLFFCMVSEDHCRIETIEKLLPFCAAVHPWSGLPVWHSAGGHPGCCGPQNISWHNEKRISNW